MILNPVTSAFIGLSQATDSVKCGDLSLNQEFSNTSCILKSPSSSSPLISLHPYVDGYKSQRLLFFNGVHKRRKSCRALSLILLRTMALERQCAKWGRGKGKMSRVRRDCTLLRECDYRQDLITPSVGCIILSATKHPEG